jgi:Zn-dependent protease
MLYFTLFQIPIQVLPWFWITMALIGGGSNPSQLDNPVAIFHLLLFIIAGFISILVHELGHGLVAKAFGKRVEIVLEAFGGYAAYSGGAPLGRGKSILITIAGPAAQILLGFAALSLWQAFPSLSSNASYFLKMLYSISSFWALLNLLPVLPLDGGRILESVLGARRIKITLVVSIIVAIGVAVYAFTQWRSGMFAIFLLMFAYQSYQALKSLR